MTPEEIEEIRERLKKASGPEWTATEAMNFSGTEVAFIHSGLQKIGRVDYGSAHLVEANADFIAHARTDIPRLLTALEEAEAVVEARNELVEELSVDLYYEIRHRYRVGDDDEIHPALMEKWARDMDVVVRAREAVGLPELEEARRALDREE